MASGRRHRTLRLKRLLENPPSSRAGKRQLRKLLGRAWGLEWRVFGQTLRSKHPRNGQYAGRRVIYSDQLNREIAANTKAHGHVAQRLRGPA